MNEDYKLKDKDKSEISMRVVILILSLVAVSYAFKMCGSEIFNKFVTNEVFINISNFIDTNYIANIVAYGLLSFVVTYFTIMLTSKTLRLKIWQVLSILIFCLIMSWVRLIWYGIISFLFDLIQYIIIPVLFSKVFYKRNILNALMLALVMYFVFNGMLFVNMSLCELKNIYYTSNFVAYVLCFIEPYLFVVAFSIYNIKGEQINDKSNISIKQEKRANARIQKNRKW